MVNRTVELDLLPGHYAVVRLGPAADIPDWAWEGELVSVTRTEDELSILCRADAVPSGIQAQRGFRCLRVAGPLAFTEVGVLDSLAHPLAEAGVSIFAISTYDTDYLLLPGVSLEEGVAALGEAGHAIRR